MENNIFVSEVHVIEEEGIVEIHNRDGSILKLLVDESDANKEIIKNVISKLKVLGFEEITSQFIIS